MSKSRIGVLELSQKVSDLPMHFIPRKLAEAIVLDFNASRRKPDLIILTTKKSFATVKLIARKRLAKDPVIPVITPLPGFEDGAAQGFLPYSPGHDQSSFSSQNCERIWGWGFKGMLANTVKLVL
jgi:hypothetical protein